MKKVMRKKIMKSEDFTAREKEVFIKHLEKSGFEPDGVRVRLDEIEVYNILKTPKDIMNSCNGGDYYTADCCVLCKNEDGETCIYRDEDICFGSDYARNNWGEHWEEHATPIENV